MKKIVVTLLMLLMAVPAFSREIAGLTIAEEVPSGSGSTLQLNGAGIRSKLIFKVYIGALYLEEGAADSGAVLAQEGARQMVMTFLYKEVSRAKLVTGWQEGFAKNLTREEHASLQERINQFNELFVTVKKGDVINLAYEPGVGTRVLIRGEERGVVVGKEFNDALLKIWLGPEPVTAKLRDQLLGRK